ncbi:MAG: cyclopropane fatty acyl phospholipid synthase [Pseudomonadota bacterium]
MTKFHTGSVPREEAFNHELARPRSRSYAQKVVEKLLNEAGISVNGNEDWDIQVHNHRFYSDVLLRQSLGLGESYMRGDWSARSLDLFIEKLFRSEVSIRKPYPAIIFRETFSRILNMQSRQRAAQVCQMHYDLDNDLFCKMLDERMVYTCAYWNNASTLEQAQVNKLELICNKLGLEPGMRVLDIGCGFGSFMKYAAETRGVSCIGYSLSEKQTSYGRDSCKGLPVEFVLDDYRNIKGKFDRVVSVGMLEAVGHKNLSSFMSVAHSALSEDGIALIHTVGHNHSTVVADPWVDRYIFPNGHLPSVSQLGRAIEKKFVLEDLHNFGPDYVHTLLEWNQRFQRNWHTLKNHYSEEFKRMWEFYLLSFAGGFRARRWQLFHLTLTPIGRGQPKCRIS